MTTPKEDRQKILTALVLARDDLRSVSDHLKSVYGRFPFQLKTRAAMHRVNFAIKELEKP